MSLRKLLSIKAFERPDHVNLAPPDEAMAKWKPGIHATTEGTSNNIISIYDVIGEDFWTGDGVTSKRVAAALRSIGDQDVIVNLNSPGGDFFEGVAIYSLLKEHPRKVTVKIMGLAASAASVVAMAGDDIQISKAGFMMIHNTWVLAIGNKNDLREAATTLDTFDESMAALYASRSGVTQKKAQQWMDDETWFNGQNAVDEGMADSILASTEIEDKPSQGTKSLAAVRRVDSALARLNLSRNERRSLIGELKGGMQDAAPSATHDAGGLSEPLLDLLRTIKGS
jgi:ATP-dependent Clp protease protease subunit